MPFDFDAPLQRADTDSVKWSRYPGGVIPLWVADMDFAAPPPVLDALRERLAHGVFGYNRPTESQNGAVVDYLDLHWRDMHWPAFNLADIFIVGSAALLVLAAFRPGANGQQTGQGSTG